jgi:aspartyl-tRNA synthetase
MSTSSIGQPDTHSYRTHTCGELGIDDIGSKVTLKGWVDTRRDLGGVIFIDLRDRYGLTQIVLSPQDDAGALEIAEALRSEWVISIEGTVTRRSDETINTKLATGGIEVRVDDLIVLNRADAIPFPVSTHEEKAQHVNEDLRLKYRYLDLRRPQIRENIVLRSELYQSARRFFHEESFLEVETPVLMKSTPEGARDFLVPSRVHPGKFFALPQSPQTYKQILMIAGMDRYFQITKCFRDEDLRADRQPEFTQIDVEMTFPTEELIYETFDRLLAQIWKDLKGCELQLPIARLTYADAVRRFGSDKPDLRFGLEIQDATEAFTGSGFRVFDNVIETGGKILAIVVPGEGDRGRGVMDRLDKDIVRKRIGAGGLVYFKLPSDGGPTHSSVKAAVLPAEVVDKAAAAVGAKTGDLVLILAGEAPKVHMQMGDLRLHMGRDLGLINDGPDGPWKFAWITDFPLLEWDEGSGRFHAMHHPFTSPHPEDMHLMATDPGAVRARAYDITLNGNEIGGGSIRIHNPEIQRQMFAALGIDEEEAEQRFGFLLDAFRFGAPPHGGIAFGLDRIVMLLAGAKSLRDVIAFPKTQSAQETMVVSPDVVDAHQLKDLHIALALPKED